MAAPVGGGAGQAAAPDRAVERAPAPHVPAGRSCARQGDRLGTAAIHAGHVEWVRRSENGTDLTARLATGGAPRSCEVTGSWPAPARRPTSRAPTTRSSASCSTRASPGSGRTASAWRWTGCGRAIDAGGEVVEGLSVIGALRKGTVFETTAIPELREQAADLARRLAG